MSTRLSPDDPNRRLAEKIGRALERGEDVHAVDSGGDDLMGALLEYRRAVRSDAQPSPPSGSEALWMRIEGQMVESDSSEAERRTSRQPVQRGRSVRSRIGAKLSTAWRLGTAAVVLALLGVAVWLLLPDADGRLVAEAGSEVTTYQAGGDATVQLRPQSALYRVGADEARRFRLEGEAVFAVAPQKNRPFEVVAGNALVRVRGTRFTVRGWSSKPAVYLEEGEVELVSRPQGKKSILRPGQRGRVAASGEIVVDSTAAGRYVDWLRGRMTLDARAARSAAAELEHHYDITIRLPSGVASETLSGTIVLEDTPDRSLRELGLALGGRFESTGAHRYHFRSASAPGKNQ